MLITPQYPVSPGTMTRNASTAEHPQFWKGLVGSWGASIDPSAHDLSGYGNDGSFVSAVTNTRTLGIACWDFVGSGDYIDTGAPVVPAGDWTVMAWINPDVSQVQDIIGQWKSASAARFEFAHFSGVMNIYIGGSQIAFSSASPTVGAWTHCAATRRGSAITMYMNGVADGTGSSSQTIEQDTTTTIGTLSVATVTQDYNGQISDVLISGNAWNASDIAKHYRLTSQDRTAWARRKQLFIPHAPAAAPAGGNPWNYYAQQGAA